MGSGSGFRVRCSGFGVRTTVSPLEAFLFDAFRVPFCLRRLQVVEEASYLNQGLLGFRIEFLSDLFADVPAVNRILEVVLALQKRGFAHLHESCEVGWVEPPEAFADMTDSGCRRLPKLSAQALVSR